MPASFYNDLLEQLRELCDPDTGEFTAGDRFLTERQVAERFETTRPTANKALAGLVSQGVLVFRRGVGTFVCDAPRVDDLRSSLSLSEQATAVGLKASSRVTSFRRMKASRCDEAVRDALRLESADVVLHIARTRLIDRAPFSIESWWIVDRLCDGISRADAKGSLTSLWEDTFRLEIAGVDEATSVTQADKDVAAVLNTKRGAAVWVIEEVGLLTDGTRLWMCEKTIRGDRYQRVGRLGGPASGRPTVGRLLFEAE